MPLKKWDEVKSGDSVKGLAGTHNGDIIKLIKVGYYSARGIITHCPHSKTIFWTGREVDMNCPEYYEKTEERTMGEPLWEYLMNKKLEVLGLIREKEENIKTRKRDNDTAQTKVEQLKKEVEELDAALVNAKDFEAKKK